MKLGDVNPFLRYVSLGNQRALDEWVCALDERLFFILGGECAFESGGEEYPLLPYTLVLVRAGTPYRFKRADDMRMLILNFDLTRNHTHRKETLRPLLLHDFDKENILENVLFEDIEALNKTVVLGDMQGAERTLTDVVETFDTPNLFREEFASAKLKLLFCQSAEKIAYADSGAHSLVDKALDFIKTHYAEEITNDEVGKALGYHSYYLNRLMIRGTGKSIHQHLLAYRLAAAKELLVNGERDVTEIAEACGFSSLAVFSAFFKERTGEPPSAFRKRYANRL